MTPGKIKIVHLIPTLGPGGSERYLLDLIRNTDSAEFEVHVCVLQRAVAFPGRWEGIPNIRFLDESVSWSRASALLSFRRKLRRLIGSLRPDVIHSHLWLAHRMALAGIVGTDVAHLVHVHERWGRLESGNLRDRAMRMLLGTLLRRRRTRVVAVSSDTRRFTQRHLRVLEGRVETVPNGVDTQTFAPSARRERRPGELSAACVGWFSGFKGQDLLIRVSARLKEQGLLLRLNLVGEGKCLEACKEIASELGVCDRVRFLGLIDDVRDILHESDLFCLPTCSEGLPLSLLEAMACGIPGIVSNAGGIPEVVTDGVDGVVLEDPAPENLAVAFLRFYAKPSLVREMGKAARAKIERGHRASDNAAAIAQIYRELFAGRRVLRPGFT